METLTKTLLTGIYIMVNGAVLLFAPKVVVQVVQVVQNKKSKKISKLLDTADILSYTNRNAKKRYL